MTSLISYAIVFQVCLSVPHFKVEAGFVEVGYRGLLMNQLCKLDSELLALIYKLLVKCSVICGRR